jgi:hypothetical protein
MSITAIQMEVDARVGWDSVAQVIKEINEGTHHDLGGWDENDRFTRKCNQVKERRPFINEPADPNSVWVLDRRWGKVAPKWRRKKADSAVKRMVGTWRMGQMI